MKKRVLSVLVAIMLVVASFASVSAATCGVTADATKVAVGDKVKVSVVIPDGTPKAVTIQFNLNFDNEAFKVVSYNPVADEMGLKGVGTEDFSGYEYDADSDSYVADFARMQENGQVSAAYIGKGNVAAINLADGATWEIVFEATKAVENAKFDLIKFVVDGINEETAKPYSLLPENYSTSVSVKVEGVCEHNWELAAEKVEPTCLAEGKEAVYVCTICGEEKGGEAIKKLDHVWGEWELNEDGETESRTCTLCGTVQTREYNPETGDTMMAVLFLGMAAMFVAGIVVVNKARKNA